ncbi:MAG: F0F1 ATP synthase subunit B [Bacteroidales bacterium]
MDLVTPGIGLIFWMIISFSIVLYILGKFAWKPILNALRARESSIEDALQAAERAKEKLARLQSDNEKIMAEARLERDNLLKEAKHMKDQIIVEAREKAVEEAAKLLENARASIKNEKLAAIQEMKTQMAILATDVAEKIIKHKLEDNEEQKQLIDSLLKESIIN